MSNALRGPWVAAIVSASLAAGVAAPAHAETLADALDMAYRTNPSLLAQRESQKTLDESYVQARAGWRPTLGFSASAQYEELRIPTRALLPSDIGTHEYGNFGAAGLTFTQPIWTGGRVAAAVDAAEADVLQGRETLRRSEASIMGQVIQAYMDVRRDQQSLIIAQDNQAVLLRQLQESQARFDSGELTRTDVALSQARFSEAEAQVSSAQGQLTVSRSNYAAVVGQNPGDLAPEPSIAFLLPATVDEAFDVAEKNNPLLRAQQYGEAASRARVAEARANRMPQLSLQTRGEFDNAPVVPFTQGLYRRNVTTTLSVSVPLFTGGSTSSVIRQEIERNNIDRLNVEADRRSTLQSITTAWAQLTAARANITITAEQVRASHIAAEGTREEQSVGLRSTIDVLNAQQEREQAELNQVDARHDEYVAAASVLINMGRLEAKNLIPTTPQYDPKANFRKLRITWGWVPWEEPISLVDHLLTPTPSPAPKERPVEKAIGPGFDPPPAAPAVAVKK